MASIVWNKVDLISTLHKKRYWLLEQVCLDNDWTNTDEWMKEQTNERTRVENS